MKWCCGLLFLSLFVLSTSGTVSAQGTIQGFVSDSLTSEALPGANVLLVGTSLGSSTDLNGHYRISNVPVGQYEVRISYIGYGTKTATVSVISDQITALNILLPPQEVRGKEVIVSVQAKGQLAAINQQVRAATIMNVVSEEKIQELPDANAAEAIGRLPGVSIIRSGGEATKVVLRGLSSKFSNITVDGVTIPGTDSTSRDVDLSMLSQGSLAGIELYKALLPDQDGDAIAGTINLVTRNAPSARLVRFDLKGDYNRLMNSAGQYDFSGRYGERFFDGVLGVQLQGNLEQKIRSKENTQWGYTTFQNRNAPGYDSTGAFANDYNLSQFNVYFTDETRKRNGAQAIFDLNTPDSGSVKLSGLYSGTQRNILYHSRYYIGPSSTNTWDYDYRYTQSKLGTVNASLQGNNFLAGFEVTWNVSYAHSFANDPFDYEVIFKESQSPDSSMVPHKDHPELYIIPFAVNNYAAAACSSAQYYQEQNFQKERTALLNIARKYGISDALSGEFKFGGKYRERTRWMNRIEYDDNSYLHSFYFTDANGDSIKLVGTRFQDYYQTRTDSRPSLSDFIDLPVSSRNLLGLYQMTPLISMDAMKEWYDLNRNGVNGASLEYNPNAQAILDDYGVTERISAGYVMNTFNFGQEATLIAGLRVESESNDYRANFSPGGLQTIGIVVSAPAGIVDTTARYKETIWLPNAQLVVRPTDFLTLRLAAYRALARPDYNLRLPQFILGTGATSSPATMGNPGLKDSKAWNFEINPQIYSGTIGLISVSVFFKRIDDLYHQMNGVVVNRGGDSLLTAVGVTWQNTEPFKSLLSRPLSYAYTVPYNSTQPTYIWGVELEHQINFSFLPDYLSNISLSYNVSLTRSQTYIVMSKTISDSTWIVNPHDSTQGRWSISNFNVAAQTKRQSENQPTLYGNVALGYDIGGLSARLSLFSQGQYVQQYSATGANDIVVNSFSKLDLALRYQFSEMFALFLNIDNITNVQESTSISNRIKGWHLVYTQQLYGTTADFGVRINF
jgi:TonB-dependent receptor